MNGTAERPPGIFLETQRESLLIFLASAVLSTRIRNISGAPSPESRCMKRETHFTVPNTTSRRATSFGHSMPNHDRRHIGKPRILRPGDLHTAEKGQIIDTRSSSDRAGRSCFKDGMVVASDALLSGS